VQPPRKMPQHTLSSKGGDIVFNTIVLMSDQHNPFVSSVYGHPIARTPNMERMAQRGTWFRNAWCPSPLCMPSRSAFMAGRRVHELQTYNNCNLGVCADAASYGKTLRDGGVHTVYVGKVDAYDRGERLGFSEMLLPEDRNPPGDAQIRRRPLQVRHSAARRADGYGVKEEAFNSDLGKVDRALRWLAETAPELGKPWTLTVNLVKPHSPQWNTREFWERVPEGDLPRWGMSAETAQHPYAGDLRKHFCTETFTEEQTCGLRRGYYGNVSFVDRQLGRLMEAMERAGLAETTNLIYVSDHGEMLGKFGLWWKSALYEDAVRVPCFAMGPSFRSGATVATPVDLLDVRASLFRSAGAPLPAGETGTPLQDIPADDPKRVVFAEYHGHGTRSGAFAVRNRDWKLIWCAEAPHQLFHLAEDPDELRNRYEDCLPEADKLEAALRKICSPEAENERAHEFEARQLALLDAHRGKQA